MIAEHDRLRLSPEDAALLWGIVDDFRFRQASEEPWPRLERIVSDLEAMMRKQENADAS